MKATILLLVSLVEMACLHTEASPGQVIWEQRLGSRINGSPAIAPNGDIIVATAGGLYACASNGSNRWSFLHLQSVLGASTVAPDGTIYFGSDSLYALNPEGVLQWQYRPPQTPGGWYDYVGSPVIGPDGAIYFQRVFGSSGEQNLFCINTNGTLRWSIGPTYSQPPVIAGDGTILLPSVHYFFVAVNTDGIPRWQRNVGDRVTASAALAADGAIFLPVGGSIATEGALQVLESDGMPRWRFETGTSVSSSPVIGVDGTCYFGTLSGRLFAVTNGFKRWEYAVEGTSPIYSTPCLGRDGTTYLAAGHWLHALGTNGEILWRHDFGTNAPDSPVLDDHGTIYLGVNGQSSGSLVAIESGGEGLAPGQWPMFRRDQRHHASIAGPVVAPSSPTNVAATVDQYTEKVVVSWSSVQGASHYDILRATSPVTNDAIVVGREISGRVSFDDRSAVPATDYYYFVRARNVNGVSAAAGPVPGRRREANVGEPWWLIPTGGQITGSPALSGDGTVYFGSGDGFMYAVEANGVPKWAFNYGGPGTSSPTVGGDGTVYFIGARRASPSNPIGEDRALFALDPLGAPLWTLPVEGEGATGVAVAIDGTLYVGVAYVYAPSVPPALMAINPDGTLKWRYSNGRNFSATPVIGVDGTIYAVTRDGWLHALRPDGVLLWEAFANDGFLNTPIIDGNGMLYFGGENIHAFNPDGQERWSKSMAWGGSGAGCVDSNGIVYAGGVTGPNAQQVFALFPNGSTKWSFPLRDIEAQGIAIDSVGNVYATTRGGSVVAISPHGTELWRFRTANIFNTPTMGSNSLLFVGAGNGTMYALRTAAGVASSAWPQAHHDSSHSGRATQMPPLPDAPLFLDATFRTRITDIRLTWPSVPGASSYEIFRSQGSNVIATNFIAEITGRLQFDDSSVLSEVPYTYQVRAKNPGGTGPFTPATVGMRRQAQPGELLYEWNLGSSVQTSPAVGSDGLIYVTAGSKLFCLQTNGTIRWEYDAPVSTSPTLGADGTIYVGTHTSRYTLPSPSKVLAIAPNGALRWEFNTSDAVLSTPALAGDGTIYFGSNDGTLYAVDAAGNRRWVYRAGDAIESSPAVGGDGALYVLARDGFVYALSPDGSLRWRSSVGFPPNFDGPTPSLALAADGTIYATPRGLTALNMDGSLRWQQAASATFHGSPVIDPNGRVILGGGDGFLYSIAPDGTQLWRTNTGGFHYGACAISTAGLIYTANYNSGKVRAFTFAGSNVWELPVGVPLRSSPAVAPDGTIYIGGDDGKLRSIFGSGALGSTPWPMFQHDLRHTGREITPPMVPGTPTSVVATDGLHNDRVRVTWTSVPRAWFYEVWRVPTTNLNEAVQVVAHSSGTLFDDKTAVEGVEYFYFVRAGNSSGLSDFGSPDVGYRRVALQGEIVGVFTNLSGILGPVATGSNDVLYFSTRNFRLYAVDGNFNELWRFDSPGLVMGTPVVSTGGVIYVTSNDGSLRALGPNGTLLWRTNDIGARYQAAPALGANGTIYLSSQHGRLYALSPEGTLLWQLATPGVPDIAPAVGIDGTIYAGFGTNLYAVSSTGHLRWRFSTQALFGANPAIGPDGTIYLPSNDGQLYALSPVGQIQWTFNLGGSSRVPPVIGPDCTIYAGGAATLFALQADGTKKWQVAADSALFGAPVVAADGTVFFGTAGSVYALDDRGGQLWRSTGHGSGVYCSLIHVDRRLMVSRDFGSLVALRTDKQPTELHWPMAHGGAHRNSRAPSWLQSSGTEIVIWMHEGDSFTTFPKLNLAGRVLRRAELFSGTNRLAVSTSAPFQLSLTNLPAGTNQFYVIGYDDLGCSYRSADITIVAESIRLAISHPTRGLVRLNVRTLPGRTYTLERTADLTNWQPIDTKSASGNELDWVLDRIPRAGDFRIYRVRSEQ